MTTTSLEPLNSRTTRAPNAFGATPFSMRGLPMLSQGQSFDPLAAAENLWLSVKVYANGGENALHRHTTEDHAFVVVQGRASFAFEDGSTLTLGKHEGLMLPKGVLYKFTAHEEENLVMIRIGGAQRKQPGKPGEVTSFGMPTEIAYDTYDADTERKSTTSTMTGKFVKPPVKVPGKFLLQD